MGLLKNESPAKRTITGIAAFEGGETKEEPDNIVKMFDGLPDWKAVLPEKPKYSPSTSKKKEVENIVED